MVLERFGLLQQIEIAGTGFDKHEKWLESGPAK